MRNNQASWLLVDLFHSYLFFPNYKCNKSSLKKILASGEKPKEELKNHPNTRLLVFYHISF